jgi:hypothetical protein
MSNLKITYESAGTANQFSFNFPVYHKNDVKVLKNGLPLLQTEYTISLSPTEINPDYPHTGGSVVLKKKPKTGDKITIIREIQLERVVDYQPTLAPSTWALNMDFNYCIEVLKDFRRELAELGALGSVAEIANGMQAMAGQISATAESIQNFDPSQFATAEALAAKANVDLSNIPAGFDLIKESGGTPSAWWRKYKNGWIEQGGYGTTIADNPTPVNLPIAMANTNYIAGGALMVNANYSRFSVQRNGASQILVMIRWESAVDAPVPFSWEVKGYYAQ